MTNVGDIEKTVFLSYRRSKVSWAISISQYLTGKGYDVFFDYKSMRSGNFIEILEENIRFRSHFLILLTRAALDRCNDPKDIFRREIEIAIKSQRNIIPIFLEGFDFNAPKTAQLLQGKFSAITKFSGLTLYPEYFEAGMQKLCDQFLNIPVDKVKHPVTHTISEQALRIIEEQKRNLAKEAPVDINKLSAQECFDNAYGDQNPNEQIRLYSKAIELNPKFRDAFFNRSSTYVQLHEYEKAMDDLDQVDKLNPADVASIFDVNYGKACIYALQRKAGEAVKCLRQSLSIRNPFVLYQMASQDCDFDTIRQEYLFQNFLEELKTNFR